jgi:hypothetical protein
LAICLFFPTLKLRICHVDFVAGRPILHKLKLLHVRGRSLTGRLKLLQVRGRPLTGTLKMLHARDRHLTGTLKLLRVRGTPLTRTLKLMRTHGRPLVGTLKLMCAQGRLRGQKKVVLGPDHQSATSAWVLLMAESPGAGPGQDRRGRTMDVLTELSMTTTRITIVGRECVPLLQQMLTNRAGGCPDTVLGV